MKKDYEKAGLLYFLATLFTKGVTFLTVPIFTRLLTTADYGIVTTYNSWVSISTIGLSLALYMAIRTSFVDYTDYTKEFLNTIITFTLWVGGIVIAIAAVVSQFLSDIMSVMLMCCVFQGFADALIMNYTQYLMMKYQYKMRTVFMILPNLFAIIFSICAIKTVLSSAPALGRIIPTAFMYVMSAIIIIFLVYRDAKPKINKEYLTYALKISLPLILHGAALTILSQSDRTMITLLADASQTGIYSVVFNFGMIATVITTTLQGIWVPWFMAKMKSKAYKDINIVVVDYIHFMTYAICGLLMVGPEILKLMATKAYWEGIAVIPPIILSSYINFVYGLYVNVEHYNRETIKISVNTVIAAICNIVLNFIFIPHFGYIAAGFTTTATNIISLLIHAKCSRKLNPEVFPVRLFFEPLIHLAIFTALFYLFADHWMVRWGVIIVYITLMAIRERKKIQMIWLNFLGKRV